MADETSEATPRRDIERGLVGLADEHGRSLVWAGLWAAVAVHLTDGIVAPFLLLLLVST